MMMASGLLVRLTSQGSTASGRSFEEKFAVVSLFSSPFMLSCAFVCIPPPCAFRLTRAGCSYLNLVPSTFLC